MGTEQRPSPRVATRRRWAAVALLLVAPALAVVAALTGGQGRLWITGGVALATGAVVVSLRPRFGRTGPSWRLIGLGLALWAAGLLLAAGGVGHDGDPSLSFPSVTDAPRLAGQLMVAAGLIGIASMRLERTDWIGRVDALLAAVGGAGTTLALVADSLAAQQRSVEAQAVAWSVLAAGVLGGTATVRLALTGVRALPSGRFLVSGAFLLLLGAAGLRIGQLDLVTSDLRPAGAALSVLGAVGMAAAAVHPSAARLGELQHRPAHALPRLHLAVLVAVCVAAPAAATARHALGHEVRGVVVGPMAMAVIVLLIVRLQLVVRSGQRQAQQAETLREAALAIGSGRSPDDVRRTALRFAVALAGGDVRYAAWLARNERGTYRPVEVVAADRQLRREDTDLDSVLAQVVDLGPRPLRMIDVAGQEVIVAPVPARLGGGGALAVAPRREAAELAEGLAVLATQSALAIDSLVQERQLERRQGEARIQQLVRHSSDAVVIVDRSGTICYQTPSVVRVLGYLAVDLDGEPITRIVHADDVGHLEHFLDALVAAAPETARSLEVQLCRADDSVIFGEMIGVNLIDNPDVGGLVLTIRDVTGRRALQDQLRHQAFHDALTGLANRALFADRVEHALHRVRRYDAVTPAVLFIDLDDFKMVNDSLGHDAGDQLLVILGDRLRSVLRAGDTAARLGGDEFAILIEDAPDVDTVREVAERVLDAVAEPMMVKGRLLHLRASVGVALRTGPDMSPGDLLRNADLAMYAAKAAGKGCVEVFEPAMHHRAVDLLTVRADLEADVSNGRIQVVYQPILRLSDRQILGFEALARWEHPERGLVGPSEFLPIAEETGVVVPLGRLVLRAATEQLARWRETGGDRAWTMSVNLSPREVLAADLVEAVERALADSDLDPSSLMIELTEPSLLGDTDAVLHRIQRLKELGVRIAIDNFGTGYSSLGYLQRIPLDVVKIDRSLVSALRTQDPHRTVARTVIDLVRTLDREVVAQGIEDPAELDGLLALGCRQGQGFLLHRPVSGDELAAELGLVGSR
jgi:diguanylate cyclase (GGDEF)-like protein/PAS domain S-box-containing protein